jgi:hypothetical protein
MRNRRALVAVLLWSALSALACKRKPDTDEPPPEEVLRERSPAAEQVLRDAESVAKLVESEPPVGDDAELPRSAPSLSSSKEVAIEHAEILAKLERDPTTVNVPVRVLGSGDLHRCSQVVRHGDRSLGDSFAARDVEQCAKTKYLLVVRTRRYSEPRASGLHTFSPGEIAGDAILYELRGSKRLGAFSFTVTNPATLKLSRDEDPKIELDEDLRRRLGAAIRDGKYAKATSPAPSP